MHLCYFVYRCSTYDQHGADAECRHRHRIGVVQAVYNKENKNMVHHSPSTSTSVEIHITIGASSSSSPFAGANESK